MYLCIANLKEEWNTSCWATGFLFIVDGLANSTFSSIKYMLKLMLSSKSLIFSSDLHFISLFSPELHFMASISKDSRSV